MTELPNNYLSDMLDAAKSKSGDELLVFTVEQVLKSKPGRAEVLRKAAIPRWFDVSVIRVLREKDEGNEQIIEQMREYSFVRDLGDGRLAYHDQVRRVLREEWERDRQTEMLSIHRRLYSYFSQRTTPPGSTRRGMPLVQESTLLSVVPISPQTDLFRREALYHLLNIDPIRGLSELRVSFAELEEVHRLADADQLLHTTDGVPLNSLQQRWVQYLGSRIHQASLNLDVAAAQLEALSRLPELDPELGAEVNRSLGQVYAEIGQWARATLLYRKSLKYFRETKNPRAVANTMLLLGEAYQDLGVSTGSWHVPFVFNNPVMRFLQRFWIWLLGLPFQLAILVLGRKNRLLPIPEYCARYQNWLLIRLYNTGRGWYAQAREAFRQLGDESGMLRAEQRLIDILRLYGYHQEALALGEQLMKRPAARDPYSRAWLERTLAECHLAAGNIGSAQLLLAQARDVFRNLGDIRREAAILTLEAQAAVRAGNYEAALRNYTDGLERYRAMGFATARERILHELRAWQRQVQAGQTLHQEIGLLIASEPEKRYVGRFIRSYLRLLQVASIIGLPLALLLMAIFAPTTSIISLSSGVLTFTTFYDPLRIAGVLATLTLVYMAVYAALATAIIYLLPINRIESEQPDMIVTRPDRITRYNHLGDIESEMAWRDVQRWLALDRCIWDRPLPLYSRTFLEDAAGNDLPIDGITGWYSEVQDDIANRLETARQPITRQDLGYRLLNSKSGVAVVLGVLLLLLVTSIENGWLPLPIAFPSEIYAFFSFIVLSGVLILVPLAYWLANRPLKLQRALLLNDSWPNMLMVLGALPIAAYILSGGRAISIDALNYSTFVWGVYILAEALFAQFATAYKRFRIPVVGFVMLLAVAYISVPAYASYRWHVAYTAKGQVAEAAAAGMAPVNVPSCSAAADARNLGNDALGSFLIQGDCAAMANDWATAAEYYVQAANTAPRGSGDRALALYNLWNVARRAGDFRLANEAFTELNTLCATSFQARQICNQIATQTLMVDDDSPNGVNGANDDDDDDD